MTKPLTTQSFQLQPFPGSVAPPIQITGIVTRDRQQLNLIYILTGPIGKIQWFAPNPNPERQFGLWETTCLECFIGHPGAANYWEFNFSPNGNWNAFALSGYREELQDASEVETLLIATDRTDNRFSLSASIPLRAIAKPDQPLEMAVTAVIQTLDGELSYWAIGHGGDVADFHRRDGFGLVV
jgi:hypothetical protein